MQWWAVVNCGRVTVEAEPHMYGLSMILVRSVAERGRSYQEAWTCVDLSPRSRSGSRNRHPTIAKYTYTRKYRSVLYVFDGVSRECAVGCEGEILE